MTPRPYRRGNDFVCFTRYRWHSMPHTLRTSMCRAASERRVYVVEEAVFGPAGAAMDVEVPIDGLVVARPYLPLALPAAEVAPLQRALLDSWMAAEAIEPDILWYQSPTAVGYSAHLTASMTVYDCVDRDAVATGRAPDVTRLEYALLERADVVFADTGRSRHALRLLHPNVRQVHSWCRRNAVDELLRERSRTRARTA